MNFLAEYPKVRKWLYFVQWALNGVAAVLGAYFVAVGTPVDQLPSWYVIPLAVLPVLWTYLGLQAGANTPASDPPPPDYAGGTPDNYVPRHRLDVGETTLGLVGLVVTVVGLLLLLLSALDVLAVSLVVAVVVTVIGVVLWVWGGGTHRRL